MRKTRADGMKLDQFRTDLDQWLFVESRSYKDTAALLLEQHGFSASISSLCQWRQRRERERVLDSVAASAEASKAVRSATERHGAQSFGALADLIGQTAFEMKLRGEDLDLGTIKDLAEVCAMGLRAQHDSAILVQREREIDLKAKRLAVAEEAQRLEREKFERDTAEAFLKWREDQRAKDIADAAGVSQAEKVQMLMRLMFEAAPRPSTGASAGPSAS